MTDLDITEIATITDEDINIAETSYNQQQEDINTLDRIIGTYESYGGLSLVKPAHAPDSLLSTGCQHCLEYLSKCYCEDK